MQLAIFPLPIFLLPNGITRLRIFEQRYIRMVKEAIQGNGFALSQSDVDHNRWATWVKIIDFEMQADGFLSIDVHAKAILKIDEAWIEKDQLRRGNVSMVPHWSPHSHNELTRRLSQVLKGVFQKSAQFQSLYKETHFDSATWVCQRWLEILPLASKDKLSFIQANSFDNATTLLATIIAAKE